MPLKLSATSTKGWGLQISKLQNSILAQTDLDGRLGTPNTLATWKRNIEETKSMSYIAQ